MTGLSGTPLIDAHAHVWDRTCSFMPGARYHPDYEASIDDYLRLLDAHRIEHAVLVQPSFLGTDNGYLLRSLRSHPDRLRGIVVLDPTPSQSVFDDLSALGVIGLRYNLLSLDRHLLAEPAYQQLTAEAVRSGWWIEVQANGDAWTDVLDLLEPQGARVMVDHFGRPTSEQCLGLRRILAVDPARLCVKFSAPYRQALSDISQTARQVLDGIGAARCLWGSDWPWTQHERQHSYAGTIEWLASWTTELERAEMRRSSARLCGF